MESLILFAVAVLVAGPVLGIIALVQIGNLSTRVRALTKEVERLASGTTVAAAAPATPVTPAVALDVNIGGAPAEAAPSVAADVSADVWADKATGTSKAWSGATAKQAPESETTKSEPVASAAAAAGPSASPPSDVEGALASRWFVWVGGVAIALGGLLFVKYAHDQGLIPPVLRVVIGLAAAAGLVLAGEWSRKRDIALAQGYVPAALSAAGLVIAFGVIYAAYALYDLLSPAVCFPALVAVGLGALWLSRRQGPLIAALGLLGAYAAPALVPSDHPSVIGFFAYLLVIVVASLYELRDRPWWWLGFSSLAGAAVWSVLWLNGGLFVPSQILPIGIFALLMGASATLLPRGRGILSAEMGTLAEPDRMQPPMQVAVAGCLLATLVLASVVWQSNHGTLALLLFGLGMLALTAFGWLRDGMVGAPLAAALATLLLLMAWPDVGFHEWAMDERGLWSTVPGLIEPPRFRNAMFAALLVFTLIGIAGTWRRREKLPWATLTAGAAVLFLFGAWARADFVQSAATWAAAGLVPAVALAVLADRVWREAGRAADVLLGGVALLGLFAIDRLFDGVWQTLVIAAFAAVLALATRRMGQVGLAAIASAVAAIAAVRLFVGREFWGDPIGLPLGAHWVIYGYGIPAILFWTASRILADEKYARYRAAFEGGALGLAISLVSLELRVLIAGGITTDHMGLLELSAHGLAWLGAAYGLAYRQQMFSSFISLWGSRVLLAASCAVILACLTVRNPTVTFDSVEGGVIFNSLWLAYLLPVPLLALMARKLDGLGWGRLRDAVGVLALVLIITFVTLQVKRFFQDATLTPWFESDAESYTVSAAWVASGIAIFLAGIRLERQNIRLAGLAILALAVAKVFIFDLFALGGLWRIASIIGLGLCLIGVSWAYTRFVQTPRARSA
ncbi:MAG: DUF2339 domain-containing protein [Rhizobiales bacterium]|nr:DUF2339 domain-containing protein [Hyphomicrobiales bacterium]